jgi:hypothetical protein
MKYGFNIQTDKKGRPITGVLGGDILLEIESTDDNPILRQMLLKEVPSTQGHLDFLRGNEDELVRRIDFGEAYIYTYGERMDMSLYPWEPMTTTIAISPTRLDIGRKVRLDRRWEEVHSVCWQKYQPVNEEFHARPIAPPQPLVTAVDGEIKAVVGVEYEYKVSGYNMNVPFDKPQHVKWIVKVDGKEELQKQEGETLKLLMKVEWAGKEITVMPYLLRTTERVSVKTRVERWGVPRIFARSTNWAGRDAMGQKAEDMMYADKTPEELLAINKLFAVQLDSTDDALFADLIYLTSAFALVKGNDNAQRVVSHFRENTGTTYSSGYMDKMLSEHETLKEFIYGNNGVMKTLNLLLRDNNGDLNKIEILTGKLRSTRVKFNKIPDDYLNGMKITVDDTSAYVVYIDHFELTSSHTYNAAFHIEIYDHYGLDEKDVDCGYGYAAGFRAWYVLQHVRGYRPFLTKMNYSFHVENEHF